MNDVTQILCAVEKGDPRAASQLLPLVYDELRKLAAARLAHEQPGQTLQATALVHEAYLRLVDVQQVREWDSRGHFFAAASEAMRRIVVESARRRGRLKRGGDRERVQLDDVEITQNPEDDRLLAIDSVLDALAAEDPLAASLIKLRYFAGLTMNETARALGISRTSAYEQWTYARAWICDRLES